MIQMGGTVDRMVQVRDRVHQLRRGRTNRLSQVRWWDRTCPVPPKLSYGGPQRCWSARFDSSRWDGSTSPLSHVLESNQRNVRRVALVRRRVVAGQRGGRGQGDSDRWDAPTY